MPFFLFCTLSLGLLTSVKVNGQSGDSQMLVLQRTGAVQKLTLLDLHENLSQVVLKSVQDIVAFDYHLAKNYLYWATNSQILRNGLFPRGDFKTEVIAQVGEVGGLAVDWVHDRVYWTDISMGQLETANLNGSARQVLYRDGWPSSVVVDASLGKIFWLDKNPELNKIRHAHLDGSYPRRGGTWQGAPVLWESANLSSLSLDPFTQELYFTQLEREKRLLTVMAVDYQHKRIRIAVKCSSDNSYSMAVADGVMYFNNSSMVCWNQEGLYRNNATSHLKYVKQIKMVSTQLQQPVDDKCDFNKCGQECYVVDDFPTCACRFGYDLQENSRTCEEKGYVLLFTSDSIFRTSLPSLQTLEPYPKIQLLFHRPGSSIGAIDVHVNLNLVFWSNNRDAIFRASLDKPLNAQLLKNCTAKSLSVDWIHNHLYWTEDSTVHMSSLDGHMQTVVAEDPNKPLSIVVDPVNRLMFYSTCGWEMMIVRANLDGSNRTKLVTQDISCATSLSVNPSTKRLFWVDRTLGTSSSVYYDNRIRHNVRESRVNSARVSGDKLLWTSNTNMNLFVNQSSWSKEIFLGFEPKGLAVFSSRSQPQSKNFCQNFACGGLCIPGQEPFSRTCVCPLGQYLAEDNSTCDTPQIMALRDSPLEVLDYGSEMVTIFCDHFFEAESYDITVEVVSSFLSRDLEMDRFKTIAKTLPTNITHLQPATTYLVTVEPHPTYLGVLRTEVSTSPPPIPVKRLPLVYKPWDDVPIPWMLNDEEINFTLSYRIWEPLVSQYFLLMFPHMSSEREERGAVFIQPRALLERIQAKLSKMGMKNHFVLVKHYKNKMEFDQDPEMYLTNTPFDVEFSLAMVQVSEYNGGYGVDIALSERSRIPWPRRD